MFATFMQLFATLLQLFLQLPPPPQLFCNLFGNFFWQFFVAKKVAKSGKKVAQKVAKKVAINLQKKLQTHRTWDSMNPGRNEPGTQRHASEIPDRGEGGIRNTDLPSGGWGVGRGGGESV